MFVDGIVQHLENAMVQAAFIGVADVHAGAFADASRPSNLSILEASAQSSRPEYHAVGREVVIAAEGPFGQKIVHRFVEGDAHGGVLVVEQKEYLGALLLPHADFHRIGHFEQRCNTHRLRSQLIKS
jgi:hypothetical protein